MLTTTHVQQGCTALLSLLCADDTVVAATLLACHEDGTRLIPRAFTNRTVGVFSTWHEAFLRQQAPLPDTTRAAAYEAHCAMHAPLHPVVEAHLQVLPLCEGPHLLGYLIIERATGEQQVTPAITVLARLLLQCAPAAQERALDEVTDLLAHELRSPLLATQLAVQSAQRLRPASATTLAEQLRMANASLIAAERLIGRLTSTARMRTGQMPLEIAEVDLVVQAEAAVATQRQRWPSRIFTVVADTAALLVQADADAVGQVLDNLLTNAVRYGAAHTPIVLHIQRDGPFAQFAVHNTGPAIPPEEQPRIWERYYRAPGSYLMGGLGLGLALARSLIGEQPTYV